MEVLDLATGSGDVALALRKKLPAESRITGLDFCEPMLEKARQKRDLLKLPEDQNPFLEGDCLALPFPENSFDLVTISFGLRNLADRELGLSEMLRVLKPGGRLIVLEFTQPYLWFSPFYYLYLKGFLPWMARLVTGDKDAYLYLGSSISSFPDRPKLSKELEQAGFSQVRATPMTFSIVALHCGEKPKHP
jgi:demethylmenaquinone methyltransferase/2-methoxy-6-polyprenyl-1,4-benzoquinol methylase